MNDKPMTAPPDRLFYDAKIGQTFLTAPGIEYVQKAAIAAAEARGLRMALAVAQRIADERFDDASSAADEIVNAIAALIPPPADGGDT